MTPYQEALLALAIASESAAIELWWAIDDLGDDLFSASLAAVVAMHNAKAAALAETAFAAEASIATGTAVAVLGLPVVDDLDRLAKSATTVIDVARASDVPESIVGRLARAEPLNTAARTYSDTVRESPLTRGWTRGMDAAPCQLCVFWSREGRVWPKEHPFQTHTGCACVPRPVWARNIQSTMYTRQLERNRSA